MNKSAPFYPSGIKDNVRNLTVFSLCQMVNYFDIIFLTLKQMRSGTNEKIILEN